MAVDLGVFQNIKSIDDYKRADQEFQLKKRLAQAQINKELQPDVDKLGEQAFLKAAQGIELTPQEQAAARFVDAKSGGIMFNPVTGALQAKPRISDKIGLDNIGGGAPVHDVAMPKVGGAAMNPPALPGAATGILEHAVGGNPPDQYEQAFQAQMQQAAGNPKLQQQLKEDYAKQRMKFTEDQAKSAGFADRMSSSEKVILDNQDEGKSLWERTKSVLPGGNYLVSEGYQKLDQAQRDFINAVLRRESGAAISPSEFDNARRQYFPQPGDSGALLEQKAANRQMAIQGLWRSAGPAYKPKQTGVVNWEDLK